VTTTTEQSAPFEALRLPDGLALVREHRELLEHAMSVMAAARGPAVNLGLVRLTPTERRLFDALWINRPHAVPSHVLLELAMGPGYDVHLLHVNLSRLRAKLAGRPWRVDTTRPEGHAAGLYRLVEAEAAEDKEV
jgi:DNA-binding response OmpR family regulator